MPGQTHCGQCWGRELPERVVRYTLKRRRRSNELREKVDRSAWANYWRAMLARGWL